MINIADKIPLKLSFFRVLFAILIVVSTITWSGFVRAFFIDYQNAQNNLLAKTAQRDSLEIALQGIRNDPNHLERVVRNRGYSREGETMLKIVSANQEREGFIQEITIFLLIALITIILLVVLFALPEKTKE